MTAQPPAAALQGAWVPVAAQLAGKALALGELRVRYLLLEAGRYRIIDRSNQVVDSGLYRLGGEDTPAQLDLIGRSGMGAGRTLQAIFALAQDELTVCYDLQGGARPRSMRPQPQQLLLHITYTRAALGAAGAAPP